MNGDRTGPLSGETITAQLRTKDQTITGTVNSSPSGEGANG